MSKHDPKTPGTLHCGCRLTPQQMDDNVAAMTSYATANVSPGHLPLFAAYHAVLRQLVADFYAHVEEGQKPAPVEPTLPDTYVTISRKWRDEAVDAAGEARRAFDIPEPVALTPGEVIRELVKRLHEARRMAPVTVAGLDPETQVPVQKKWHRDVMEAHAEMCMKWDFDRITCPSKILRELSDRLCGARGRIRDLSTMNAELAEKLTKANTELATKS
jgi:hypothetical protein